MGTTSDKLLYLNSTKAAIKAAINALPNGPYIEDGATFRSYEHEVEAAGVGCMVAATDDAAWYILSPANMYTDRAGTTPVTVLDDFVGYISDSSGKSNDFVAVSDAGRALYKTDGTNDWFELDLVDDNYSTTFANPIVGTLLFGTRKGIIHLEVDIPAGAWSLTPNAAYFPGNTVTDIVIKNGYMTDAELANAKAWLASRGSPLVYTPTGTDLATAFRNWLITDDKSTRDYSGCTSLANTYMGTKLTESVVVGSAPLLTAMSSTYQSGQVNTITAGSLDGAPNITNMLGTYFSCPIASVPDGHFAFNTKINSFQFTFYGCSLLTTIGAGLFDTQTVCTNYDRAFTLTNLTQQSIDNVLASIRASYAANGLTGGTFEQSGGSAPSAAGEADIDYLRAQGMTVTVTGGY